jgi:hypothetical protein
MTENAAELYHPVTEDNAREFVDASAPSDTSDEEKDQRVEDLLRSAAENHSWRSSRDPVEQMRLESVPFATHPQDEPAPDEEDDSEGA